ncbi:outer dynein arm-docking complex subunit 4 [Microplitis demolitor]|uniref:outer dynein arm-docking complex subunit 4 n=1 Tax=Microplitis demolitor TaxID=69319 RepID=UPI0004CDDAD3|nr:outer dynein arm-docking complex subunit 4 [Microplitis demolitor]
MFQHKDSEASKLLCEMHREWGLRFNKTQQYEAAVAAFERSREEAGDDDPRTLLGLAEALVNLMRYSQADIISEKCLQMAPKNYLAKWMRIETLYRIGEFSKSLILAYQAGHSCRYPFEDAIHRANETVEDCLGYNTLKDILVALLPWMKKLEKRRNDLISKLSELKDEFEGIDQDHSRFPANDPVYQREYRNKKFNDMLTRRYLEPLAVDKFFVENLFKNPGFKTANKEASQRLLTLAQELVTGSNKVIEVNRLRKPLYVYYFRNRIIPSSLKRANLKDKQLRKDNIVIEANSLLMRLHKARVQRDYKSFFMYVDRVKNKFDSYKESMFPMKKKCLDELYRIISRAYIDARDVTSIKDENEKIRYLKHHLGLRESTFPTDSDLGWVPYSLQSRKKAPEVFRKRLAMASEPLELAWLFHEFAKLHVDMRLLDAGRYYAKRSRDMGLQAQDDRWVLNANHLLMKIEIHSRNKNEARDAALLAYWCAKKIGLDYLVDFYRRLVAFIEGADVDKFFGVDGIAMRERLMVKLMPGKFKRDMDLLLQRINFIPAKRRLSVMPGCKPRDHNFKMPCRRHSILQQRQQQYGESFSCNRNREMEMRHDSLRQSAPSRHILGWMDFEDYL